MTALLGRDLGRGRSSSNRTRAVTGWRSWPPATGWSSPATPTARRAAPSDRRPRGRLARHAPAARAGPLALCFTEVKPGPRFRRSTSPSALGFVALSVLGLQFALAARFSRSSAPFGIDAVLTYHRQISFLAVVAAFGHPVLLFLVSDKYRALLDMLHDPLRAKLRLAVGGRADACSW